MEQKTYPVVTLTFVAYTDTCASPGIRTRQVENALDVLYDALYHGDIYVGSRQIEVDWLPFEPGRYR
jgi:hypothetical protein